MAASPLSLALLLATCRLGALLVAPSGSLVVCGGGARAVQYDAGQPLPPCLRLTCAQMIEVVGGGARGLAWRGAQLMYLRGRRPIVRGTVRNPCDHPHGGRTRAIPHPQTPWGKPVQKSRRTTQWRVRPRDIDPSTLRVHVRRTPTPTTPRP
jgi:hypothetical protein